MVDADTFELIDGFLPAEARDWYSSNGYLHVRRAVDPSMCSHLALAYGAVLNRSIEDDSGDIWYAPAAHGGRIIQRFNRLNVSSPTVANFFTEHPSMLAIAKGLLGDHAHFVTGEEGSEGAVMVTKDANNVGPHGALPWHCDGSFTRHLPINPFINAGVYLEDCNEDGGCLLVIPGSHLAFSPSEGFECSAQPHAAEVAVVALAGDVVAHSSQLWHCSRRRITQKGVRRVLYANYTAHC